MDSDKFIRRLREAKARRDREILSAHDTGQRSHTGGQQRLEDLWARMDGFHTRVVHKVLEDFVRGVKGMGPQYEKQDRIHWCECSFRDPVGEARLVCVTTVAGDGAVTVRLSMNPQFTPDAVLRFGISRIGEESDEQHSRAVQGELLRLYQAFVDRN